MAEYSMYLVNDISISFIKYNKGNFKLAKIPLENIEKKMLLYLKRKTGKN